VKLEKNIIKEKGSLMKKKIQWNGKNWSDVFKFITDQAANMKKYALSPDKILSLATLDGKEFKIFVGDWITKNKKGKLNNIN